VIDSGFTDRTFLGGPLHGEVYGVRNGVKEIRASLLAPSLEGVCEGFRYMTYIPVTWMTQGGDSELFFVISTFDVDRLDRLVYDVGMLRYKALKGKS